MNAIWMALAIVLFWGLFFWLLRFLSRYFPGFRVILFPLLWLAVAAGFQVFLPYAPLSWSFLQDGDFPRLFLAAGIALLLINVLFLAVFSLLGRERRELIIPPLLRKLILLVVYFIAFVIIIKGFYPELNLTGLLIGSTVFSAVVGLALQDTLVNFISGVTLTAEKSFRLNDWIRVGDKEGLVTEISWRATRIRTRDNNLLIIPNSVISREMITNFNYPVPLLREMVTVGVSYRVPPRRVKEALLEAAGRVKEALRNPPPSVRLINFDAYSINYQLLFWLSDFENVPEVSSQIRMEIFDVFRSRNIIIPIPSPIRDVFVYRDRPQSGSPGPRLRVLEGPRAGETVAISAEEVTIGREGGNTIVIPEAAVSKRHARLSRQADGHLLEDLESKSGTFLNDRPIHTHHLRDGDEIAIGNSRFLFEESRE